MDVLIILLLFLLFMAIIGVGGVWIVRSTRESDNDSTTNDPGVNYPEHDPDHPCYGIVTEYWEYGAIETDHGIACIRLS